ncbi:MAG TPA: PH domain-containing protein [Candidatus Nanoarchaeia archaeon]|nr:PH domain-containing protein [Candidatus Nanoarchaeia archaeon]
MDRLHPGAKWQFRMGGYLLSGFLGIFLAVWIIAPLAGLLLKLGGISGGSVVTIVLLSILGYLLFVIVFSEIYAQMSYNRWFYEFTEEGLRLERGIIWKRYSNVPYERIQNVDVNRGVIARMFGFSSVMIQTAGFSGPAGAEGNIPAVEMNKAEELRSFVMKKITGRRR